MAFEFKLPDIGEGLAEGEIVKWLVSEGDRVEEDQPLVEVMTDKATVEIPSPRAGRIEELRASEGDVVEIGTTIVVFGDAGEAAEEGPPEAEAEPPEAEAEPPEAEAEPPEAEKPSEAEAEKPSEAEAGEKEAVREARQAARAERQAAETDAEADGGGPVLATPATRRLARELGVDLSKVKGSGPDGRVMKEDVRDFAEEPEAAEAAKPEEEVAREDEVAAREREKEREPAAERRAEAAEEEAAEEEVAEEEPAEEEAAEEEAPEEEAAEEDKEVEAPAVERRAAEPADREERVALRGLRRTIAERMIESKQTAAHFTYVEEVDMTEVVRLRREAKEMAAERDVKLTYLPFIIRALVLALKKHPYLNASLDEEEGEIVLKHYYNIGIAVDTDRGLIVPVIKRVDRLGVFEIAAEIQRLAAAARDGSIGLDELRGGTFTVTSTGNIGGVLATPIINVPEVAILGVTAIRERPVVRGGEIVVRHMMNLSLSLDHRVVDGAVGARFIRDLVRLLEDPKLQLLGSL